METFLIAIFAGAASAIVTQLLIHSRELWSARKASGHLALKLSRQLETYAAKCMSQILDNRNGAEEKIPYEQLSTSPPKFPELPWDDAGWVHLNRQLASEVMAFPTTIEFANGKMWDEFRYGSPATVWVLCDDECVKLASRALSIARRLRDAHDQHDVEPDWDYRVRIADEMQKLEEERITFERERAPLAQPTIA